MTDIITAIVDVLKDVSGVADLAGEHVYGDELPAALASAMPEQAALVIRPSGGASFQPAGKVKAETQRFDLVAYGPTPFEADRLRRAGARALMALQRHLEGSVLIHWVQSAGGYLTGRDRDGAWPYAFQSFQTLYATEEVTP
jgi:hypothetical protein